MTAPVYRRPDGRVIHGPRDVAVRVRVVARDRGICQGCGRDLGALLNAIATLRAHDYTVPGRVLEGGKYEVDHVVPLSEGGEDHENNARLLCLRCHRKATAELRARLARARPRKNAKAKRGLCDGSHRRPAVVRRMPERVLGCRMCGDTPGLWHGMVRPHARRETQ